MTVTTARQCFVAFLWFRRRT